ncbi:MAG: glycosyltransferase [Nitrosopumilus sp.]|nr:MAG: glycosyltransferase [Nitrosopumilus sp.]
MIIVCIPAFNAGKTIRDVSQRCKKFCDEVLVCDDGSTDNTALEGGALVVKHKKNMGKGAALRTLFKESIRKDVEIIVTIDGDGQFLPEEIPNLTTPIKDNSAEVVIGYRFESKNMPKYRKVGNKILDRLVKITSDLPYHDTQSGFRAYQKQVLESLNFQENGFGADTEILMQITKKNVSVKEEEITVLYNLENSTSTKNPISHFSSLVLMIIEIIAIKHPLRYLGIPGIGLMIIGIIFSVIVISFFNETRQFSIPSTLIALGSFVSGLMLLLMSTVLFSISKMKKREF